MAQTIKLRRSATAGATPTTSQLELGEVAINTYDGKMYIKKSVGGTESIVELGSGLTPADAILEEYLYTATASQTAFSGNDDNSDFLSYTTGALQVFLNGILLDPETDYTATNGATITLTAAAALNDYLQIFAFKKKIGDSSITINTFTGNNSTTAYTLTLDPGDENNTRVFIDGVYQSKSNYTVSGTTLTFSSAPPSGTGIEVEIGNRAVSLDTASNLDLPDNVKLRLGTSQDLEIYHNASDSLINDNGTGSLKLQTGGSTKLEVTSTGVDVTGNIVVSGTVDGIDIATRDGVLTSTTTTAGAALPKAGGAMTGAITTNSTFDGRDVATDGTKLDGIETGATADQTQSEINALGITATGLSGTPAISVANITTTGELRGPASLVIDPAAVGDNTGTVVIKGNLQVDGATTTINSTTLTVDDLNLTLASGAANGTAANGAGITVDGASATLTYVSSTDTWDFNKNVKFNTVQAHGSNNFLLDSPAEIHLDSHSGFIRLNTQGGNIGMLQLTNDDLTIRSMVSNQDIIFQGYDGSTNITALSLDMSEAGKASFNAGAYFSDSVGIGATTATTTLDLTKSTDTAERSIRIENSSARLYVGVEGTSANRFVGSAADHAFIGTTTNDGLELGTNNNVRMVINTSGNVGIGTAASSHKLDVNGTIRAQGAITSTLTSSGGTFLSIGHSGNENWSFDAKSGSGSTDYVDFGIAGGTRAMTWQEDGNVGIGTTAPAFDLDILDTSTASNTGAGVNIAHATQPQLRFTQTTGNYRMYLGMRTNDLIIGDDSGVEKVRFEQNGNVGIGTPSPNELLSLYKTAGTTLVQAAVHANSTVGFEIKKTNATTQTWRIVDGQTVNGVLEFYDATNSATRMAIKGDGKVGIGTTAPASALEIQTVSGVRDANIRLDAAGVNSNQHGIKWYSNTTQKAEITWGENSANLRIRNFRNDASASYGRIDFDVGGSSFATSPSTRMSIQGSTGNVGIGTTNPAKTLDVKGEFRVTRNVATGHASEGNWNFNISHEDAARYGSLYITPSVATGEISLMGDKFRFTNAGHFHSGNVLSTHGHANADDFIVGNISGSATGLTIVGASGSSGNIHFSDGTSSGNANIQGQLVYSHYDDSMRFYTAVAERMRIKSTGHLTLNHTNHSFSGVNNSLLASSNGYMYAMGGSAGLYLADNAALHNAIGIRDAGFIDFATGGTGEKMRIASDGAVTLKPNGITTGLRLQGRSSDNNFFIQWKSNDGNTTYGHIGSNAASGRLDYGANTHHFTNQATNNTYMVIDSGGRVGINQTPLTNNFALQVTGLGGGSGDARAVYLKGSGAHTSIGSTGPTLVLQNTNSTANNIVKLSFESASAGETVSINAINTNHTSHYGDMAFNTRGSSGYSEKMRIMANGNVGIGTTSPAVQLHINKGTSTYQPAAGVVKNYFALNTDYNAAGIQGIYLSQLDGNWIDGTSGADTAYGMLFGYENATRGGLIYDHRGSERMQLFSSYGALAFITPNAADGNGVPTDSNMVERLTILPGGNVGIGTTSPQGILHVDQGAADDHITILEAHSAGDVKLIFSQGQTAGNWGIGYDDGGGVTENSLSFAYKSDGYPSLSGQNKMVLTPAGNMGLAKSTLTTWSSGYNALQIGGRGFVGAHSGSDLYVGQNASFNSGWKYQASVAASLTQHSGGKITQYVAPAGTAGNAISWNRAIDINPTGEVGIGLTPANGIALQLGNTSNNSAITRVTNGTTSVDLTASSSGKAFLEVGTNHPLILATNATERMQITAAGDVSVASGGGLYFGGGTRTTSTNAQAYVKESGLNLDIKGNDNVRLLGDGANVILHADYTGRVGINLSGAATPLSTLSVNGVITSGNFAAASISGSIGDANTAEVGPGYINLARDDTADAAQIRFGKNGSVHSYLETRASGLGFVATAGHSFEGGLLAVGVSRAGLGTSNNRKLWVKGSAAFESHSTGTVNPSLLNNTAIYLGPSGTRATGTMVPGTMGYADAGTGLLSGGIAWDHLRNYTTYGNIGYGERPHGWLGSEIHSTPGYELSNMVMATREATANNSETKVAMRWNATGEITTPRNPAFHAYGTNMTNETTEGNHGTWNEVHDRGANFAAGTSAKFTAPVDGIYAFYAQCNFNNNSSRPFYWRAVKNSTNMGIFYGDSSSETWSHISGFITVVMDKNDTFEWRYKGDPDEGSNWCQQGGYLIG